MIAVRAPWLCPRGRAGIHGEGSGGSTYRPRSEGWCVNRAVTADSTPLGLPQGSGTSR